MTDFKWYAGSNGEYYEVGPCESKDEAINEALASEYYEEVDDGMVQIHVCEASKYAPYLADWIDFENLLEGAEDNIAQSDRVSEWDDDLIFDLTSDQIASLQLAIHKWQDESGIGFRVNTFGQVRNEEVVEYPIP